MRRSLPDLSSTQSLGRLIGAAAQPGDVIAIEGTLGAGKTSLAQGVATGLGVPADHYVNSPTFAIMQVHPGRIPFYHIDLYRLGDPDELLGLGLEEAVGTDGLAFIEWPSVAVSVIPEDAVWIRMDYEGDGRTVEFRSTGGRSDEFLARVCDLERSITGR